MLAALEEGIPLEPRPFLALAERLAVSEAELVNEISSLAERGVIRRLAVLFDSRELGLVTTLVAAAPRPGCDGEAAAMINSFDEVTHHYRRSASAFGLWFTLTARGRARIDEILDCLRSSDLVERFIEAPAEKVFKTRVRFCPMTAEGSGDDNTAE
jgi:DNA-binding Lrp family transcriptional regulator